MLGYWWSDWKVKFSLDGTTISTGRWGSAAGVASVMMSAGGGVGAFAGVSAAATGFSASSSLSELWGLGALPSRRSEAHFRNRKSPESPKF